MAVVSVSFVVLMPILLLIFNHLRRTSSLKCHFPPGPYPWPVVGNLLILGNKPHVELACLAKTYGQLMSLRLATSILVIGSSAAAAAEILKTHDRQLSGRHVPKLTTIKRPDPDDLSIIWARECTDPWKHLRTICRSDLFSTKTIDLQAPVRENKVMRMVDFLVGKEGEVVKLAEVVFATVCNILSNIYLSTDLIVMQRGKIGGEMKEHFDSMGELAITPNLADFFPFLDGFDLQGLKKKAADVIGQVSSIWEVTIQQRREGKNDDVSRQRDFLDVLLENSFTNNQINNLFMELFVAGTDTSVTTIEWAMAELVRHPEVMDKAREELKREIKENEVQEFNLPDLRYLHACLKETLRLHPPVPLLLPHRALDECELMKYTIPKDSLVQVNVWAVGREPTTWEDPLSFSPERFLDSHLDYKGNDFGFLPFSAGRRICPGVLMASRQMRLILASLIHNFDWSLPNDMKSWQVNMNEKLGVTLQKEQPLLLIPISRKQSTGSAL